jgi:TolB-like protein/DNA-binding winged helix-turn-helix (wHTH) protein
VRPAFYQVGDLLVDTGRARIMRGETEVPLSKLSFDLLLALIGSAPNLVSIDELMALVWPGLVVNMETVSQRVKLLRDALGDDSKEPRYIAGVRGRGYRMIAPVTSLDTPAPRTEAAPSEVRQFPRLRWFVFAIGVIATLTAIATLLWQRRSVDTPSRSDRVAVSALPVHSVAVLPFENLSTVTNGAVLAMGISESVLHQLAMHEQLTVIARTSSFAFEGQRVDAREIGRKLNARYLLEGSLQAEREQLRVTAQLIDSSTGANVWSMRFDRTLKDIFALQDEIALKVASALESSVTVSPTPRPASQETKSIDAWIAYQQGRALMATRKKPELERAVSRFTEAIQGDPEFASAYVALAETRLLLSLFSTSDSWLSAWPRAKSDAEAREVEQLLARAIELNPRNGHAFVVRGWIQETHEKAEVDYRHGLDLSPNDSAGYERFAKVLFFFPGPHGEFYDPAKREEAFEMIDRARELDPLTPNAHITKALMTLYGRSNVTEANALLLQALAIEPNYYPALMRLAELRWCCQGEIAEGVKYGEQALALAPQATWPRHFLIYMYLDVGDERAAWSVAKQDAPPDPVLDMILHFFKQEWRQAGEIAYTHPDTLVGVDRAVLLWSYFEHAMATGDTKRAQRVLEEWSGVSWDSKGNPRVDATHISFDGHLALVLLLRHGGDEVSAQRLLERTLQAMDYQARELKRGARFASASRAEALALLGRKDEALKTLQETLPMGRGRNAWYTLKHHPAFDGLRSDARFRAIVEAFQARMAVQREKLEAMRNAGLVPRRGASVDGVGKPQRP